MSKQAICLVFIGLICLVWRVVKAYGDAPLVMAKSCHPFVHVLMPSNPSVSRGIVSRRRAVLLILRICGQSKILQSIVKFVAIYVVNIKAVWYVAKHQYPNYPLKPKGFTFNGYNFVSRLICTARNRMCWHVRYAVCPSNYTSKWVVSKNRLKLRLRQLHGMILGQAGFGSLPPWGKW